MKGIMITAPVSNSGKTTLSFGIIRAIKNRGIDVSAFKTGPDFIDTKYLGIASGKRSGNLDIHLMGRDGIKKAIAMNTGEFAVVEGAMGYFDGMYNTFEKSSYDISKELNIPAILVYRPQGEMFSAIPKIKGMVDFPGSKIKGIILNKVNKSIYLMLKEKIEEYIDIKVLGYLPEDSSMKIESRYLGLMQAHEKLDSEALIARVAEEVEKTIDLDEIINMGEEIQYTPFEFQEKRNIRVAIAYDEAFNFYYSENLKLLENICHVTYFSPLRDREVPKSDLIYIGGGYPEIYSNQLSNNNPMLESIRKNTALGTNILAECGGFMYLVSSIEGHMMANVLQGRAVMTDRLQRFGYVNVVTNKDTMIGKKGTKLSGNEYHRSVIHSDSALVFDIEKAMGLKSWQCGQENSNGNVLGAYAHINFLGNMESFSYLLDHIENKILGGL